jgi:molybdopterin converting factor small subunit
MIKIKLRLSSWVAAKLGDEDSGWLTIEKEVREGTSIGDLLAGIVKTFPGLGESVFSPETGLMDERINIALNDHLLNSREISRIKLSDGDTVFLFPLHWGG